ncbi:MAG: C40 family peptidase [Tumebacillaceae bacterium]
MKRLSHVSKLLLGIGALAFMFGTLNVRVAHAAENDMKILVDDKPLVTDVQPIVLNDRTLLPLRAVFESLGANVEWLQAQNAIEGRKGSTVIQLHFNDTQALVNGKAVKMDVAPVVINDRTLVPVRFIAESLGATVNWDAQTNTVAINQKKFKIASQVTGQGSVVLGGTSDTSIQNFAEGTEVLVTALPAPGWVFDHWQGGVADLHAASTTVVSDANKTIRAIFKKQTQPTPVPTPTDNGGTADQSELVAYVNSFSGIGIPYLYGGTDLTPNGKGIDCSSFVQQMYAHFGVTLPRTTDGQYVIGTAVARPDLQPGDLIFFHTDGPGPTHVGIYVGDGQFVSATVTAGVKVQSLDIAYWSDNYEGARRVNP